VIEQELRARIAKLEADDQLPSDAQLCAEFAVSRMTARNAMQRLVQDGLVYRLPGKGTFVADSGAHRKAQRLVNFTEELRQRGRVATSRLLSRVERSPTERERHRLQLADDRTVVEVSRLRLADSEPVALERALLRGDTATAVLSADLERGSLHEALVASGFVPRFGKATIVAERALSSEARLLGIPRGWPLLVERRLIRDAEGVPLEATESRYVGGRYALDVDFDVEQ